MRKTYKFSEENLRRGLIERSKSSERDLDSRLQNTTVNNNKNNGVSFETSYNRKKLMSAIKVFEGAISYRWFFEIVVL